MTHHRWKVLIAEDHAPSRRLIEQALEPLGCQVVLTLSGREAVQTAEAIVPDLIFMDVLMPELNGYEACRIMRSHPVLAEVPIVLISALSDRSSRLKGLEAGADDYLCKPVDILELQTRIRTLLRLNRYRRLHEVRVQFEKLLEASPDIILIVLEDGQVVQANRSASLIGLEPPTSASVPQRLTQVLGDVGSSMLTVLRAGGSSLSCSNEIILARPGSPVLELEWRASEAFWQGTTGWMIILRDISTRKMLERERWRHVYHDDQTGIPNRVFFLERLTDCLQQGQVAQFAVLLLDIDQFNAINESLGHRTGDEILKEVCARVQAVFEDGDVLARVGEDEFAVLLHAERHVEARAHQVAALSQAQMQAPFRVEGRSLHLTLSIGITLPQPGQDAHDILRDASVATARARSLGRGHQFVFDTALHSQLLQRLDLEVELRQAIPRQELRLDFQPLVAL